MLIVADVQEKLCLDKSNKDMNSKTGMDKSIMFDLLYQLLLMLIILQEYKQLKTNPRYYSLIERFKRKTNCPSIVNTSFNVRGEPIVCTPQDAYRCFMRTEMDILVMENQIIYKDKQPKQFIDKSWMEEFELD